MSVTRKGPARKAVRYATLYSAFLGQRFKILLEYRFNFILGIFSSIFLQAAGLLTIWVVMSQIPDLNGWNLHEILLIYGLLTLSRSLSHMFADNLWTLGWNYIRSGGFDRFLVRPINPLFHLVADRFCHDGIGNFLVGTALVAQSFIALNLPWSLHNFLYLLIAVLSGGAIFMSINLITTTLSFWITMSLPIMVAVHGANEFAKFPLTIYNGLIRTVMTWLLPFGFASFYPASYLLGRDSGMLGWLAPVVAGILFFTAYRFWHFGLRHYSSTGS